MDPLRVLVRAFSSVAVSIDLSDDEDIDPDIATDIIEPAAAMFRDLSAEGRRTVAAMMIELAELESDPMRRQSMSQLPGDIGLLDEE